MFDAYSIVSGEKLEFLDLTQLLKEIIYIIIRRYETFSHIDIDNLLITLATNRKNTRRSLTFGKCVPLKFENGSRTKIIQNRKFAIPTVKIKNNVILYMIVFYKPHFFDLPLEYKIKVIFHELYHICPEFNGDIRRFGIRKAAHGASRKKYDTYFEEEMNDFIDFIKTTKYKNVLGMNYKQIHKKFGSVKFLRMKIPKPYVEK
ncbi:MAG: hypothetical protein JW982_07305 [Spirochaetes bacterium]|nr:hypothetical protein [Spirochaetota bacterium]